MIFLNGCDILILAEQAVLITDSFAQEILRAEKGVWYEEKKLEKKDGSRDCCAYDGNYAFVRMYFRRRGCRCRQKGIKTGGNNPGDGDNSLYCSHQ